MKTKIKEIRNKKNITQEELSKMSGVSRSIISGLENETIDRTTNTTMIKIAEALKVSISELFLLNKYSK